MGTAATRTPVALPPKIRESAMPEDKRPLVDRLMEEAARYREQAGLTNSQAERDALLRKADAAELACDIQKWIDSPGLSAPR